MEQYAENIISLMMFGIKLQFVSVACLCVYEIGRWIYGLSQSSYLSVQDYIYDKVEPMLVDTFFWYTRKQTQLMLWGRKLYRNYYAAQCLTDTANDFVRMICYAYRTAIGLRLVPENGTVELLVLVNASPQSDRPVVIETSQKLEYCYDLCGVNYEFLLFYNHGVYSYKFRPTVNEMLVYSLHGDVYTFRQLGRSSESMPFPEDKTTLDDIVPVRSTADFMAVEYHHPNMQNYIEMRVPRTMLYVGNQLFSPTFVLWWLEQNRPPNTYVFDLDYAIHIMDENADLYYLASDQCVQLNKHTFDILRINE